MIPLLVLRLTLGVIAAAYPAAQTVVAPQVRTDGVYYALVDGTHGDPSYRYFRFYKDGTGLTVDSTGKPSQVAEWFVKGHDYVQEGKWTLQRGLLVLRVGSEDNYTEWSGTVSADGWTMHPPGLDPLKYTLAKVVFAPEAAGNGPKIENHFKTTNALSYDDAGRLNGVTTTLEIVATDPNGGALTFECTASSGPGTIKTEGAKCIWDRPIDMGQPGNGVVTVVVTNSKGIKTSHQFVF
jgi:hypothetical protein